jgi:hypothetical protein
MISENERSYVHLEFSVIIAVFHMKSIYFQSSNVTCHNYILGGHLRRCPVSFSLFNRRDTNYSYPLTPRVLTSVAVNRWMAYSHHNLILTTINLWAVTLKWTMCLSTMIPRSFYHIQSVMLLFVLKCHMKVTHWNKCSGMIPLQTYEKILA